MSERMASESTTATNRNPRKTRLNQFLKVAQLRFDQNVQSRLIKSPCIDQTRHLTTADANEVASL